MRTLSSSANWARMPPAAFEVEPEASVSRSISTTSTPSSRRWNAVLAPIAPPPITTTSAEETTAGFNSTSAAHAADSARSAVPGVSLSALPAGT